MLLRIVFMCLAILACPVPGITGVWTTNNFSYKPDIGARGAEQKNLFDSGLDRIDARLGKEIWLGDPNYGANLPAAVTAIGSRTVILRLPAGTQNIAADLTIPANITLKAERGAILAVATTKTLTINGALDAGLYQIFSWTGTGKVILPNIPQVYPEWWGAVGDQITDDTAALNAAAASVRAVHGTVALSSQAGYAAAGQVDFRDVSIKCPPPVQISSTFLGAAVLCGSTTGTLTNLDITLKVRRPSADWTAGNISIQVINLSSSKLNLQASRSEKGIQFVASGGNYVDYNTITLGDIAYNKIGFEVYIADAISWTAENLVYGGYFSNSAGLTGGQYAINLVGNTSGFKVGKWLFFKPGIEYGNTDFLYGFVFNGAEACEVHYPRWESSGGKIAKFTNKSNNNVITFHAFGENDTGTKDISYDEDTYSSNYCYGNIVRSDSFGSMRRIWDSTSFASAYHDGTCLHVPGFQIFSAWASPYIVARKQDVSTYIGLTDGSGSGNAVLSFANDQYAVGVAVKFVAFTNGATNKMLFVRAPILDYSKAVQLIVQCFDSTGAKLEGTSPYYVQGPDVQYNSGSGRSYYTILIKNPLTPLHFNSAVAKVYVGLGTTHSGYPANGLEILAPFSVDAFLDCPGPRETPDCLYASQAPTKWHFQVGKRVLNDAPAAGAPQGWVCIKRTDATVTANASGGDTTLTVNSITGIASGDIIGLKLNTGLYHFTTVNSAPSGSTVTLTAAVPGSGVVANSGNAVVANLWRAMPNL